jgi:hypothetical protein
MGKLEPMGLIFQSGRTILKAVVQDFQQYGEICTLQEALKD